MLSFRPSCPTGLVHFVVVAPPCSLVCSDGHVLSDELAHEPPLENNGALRCNESGCYALVFSHCDLCQLPIPGFIDGFRFEVNGPIAAPKGRTSDVPRGTFGFREWREDCPRCKAPYPWARPGVLAEYHRQHLAHLGKPTELPLVERAKAAYDRQSRVMRRESKQKRRDLRRMRLKQFNIVMFDTWPKRILAIIGVITAVLVLVFGVSSFSDIGDEDPKPTAPTTGGGVTP